MNGLFITLYIHSAVPVPGQIQYGGFKRALAKKSGDMIRDQIRILYLLFLWGILNWLLTTVYTTFDMINT